MSSSAVDVGNKLHIITRRRFEEDVRRHFVGEVIGIAGELLRIRGFAFVFSPGVNQYRKLPELRTRLFSVGQDGFIVNVLPPEVSIEALDYRIVQKRLVVTDDAGFVLDVNEFGVSA